MAGHLPVKSVKLQIVNYFWLTANPVIHEISSTIIGLAVTQSNLLLNFALVTGQVTSNLL